jgi:hypothetical protein
MRIMHDGPLFSISRSPCIPYRDACLQREILDLFVKTIKIFK